jgi:4-hydroxy-tetrahydrodipicolinate synthase
MMIRGAYTALVTPFDSNGELDEEGLRKNIQFQIANDIDGIVVLGSTGESSTLTAKEKERVIHIAVEEAKGQIQIMVGTGSYSTQQTIENTLLAKKLGADSVLIITPYSNKPTQEGLFQHFKAIDEATHFPTVVYNVQGRTGVNVTTDTLMRIACLPNIVGVKEASGNISQISEVMEFVVNKHSNFSLMSGDDGITFPLMALGGHGVISVVSNLIPKQVKSLVSAMEEGNFNQARKLHYQLMPLFRGAFIETNPMPINAMMNHFGMPAGKCRLPLCDLTLENAQKLNVLLNSRNWFDLDY